MDAKGVRCSLFVIVFRHFQGRELGNMYCFRKEKINCDFILYSRMKFKITEFFNLKSPVSHLHVFFGEMSVKVPFFN